MFLSFIFVAKILCFSWKICLVKQVSLNPGKNFRYLTNCNKYILSVLSCSRRGGRSFYQDGAGGDVKKTVKKNTISRVSHHEIIHFVFSKINYFQLWLSHNSKWPARIVRMKHFSVQKIGVKWNSVDSPFHEKFGKRYFKYVSIIFLEKNSWKLVKMWICL